MLCQTKYMCSWAIGFRVWGFKGLGFRVIGKPFEEGYNSSIVGLPKG